MAKWRDKFTKEQKEMGDKAEERFHSICRAALVERKFPRWVLYFQKVTQSEDSRGIDAWAITADTPPIPLQIKRSRGSLKSSRSRLKKSGTWDKQPHRQHIRVIIVSPRFNDKEILNRIIQVIESERQKHHVARSQMK